MHRSRFIPRPRLGFAAFGVAAVALLTVGLVACGDDDNTSSSNATAAPGSPDFRTATPGGSPSAATSPSAAATSSSAVAGQQAPTQESGPVTLTISTPDDIHYDKQELDVSPGQQVTVNYTNDSNIPHNIHFFNGPDASSPSLGASTIGTGPGNNQTVSFTAPSTPGTYFFQCDVHTTQMTGHLVVK